MSYSPHPYLTQDVVDLFIQEKLENIIAILHRVHIGHNSYYCVGLAS